MATSADTPLTVNAYTNQLIVSRLVGERPYHQSLNIKFERTVRVADNGNASDLPPGLGTFPIYKTADYAATLPSSMAGKGGFMIPMYRKSPYVSLGAFTYLLRANRA